MKVAVCGLLALLAGGAQAQTVENYQPYTPPLVPVAAPSLYIPPLYTPPLNTPPIFIPPLIQNARGPFNHPLRVGVGGAYVGYQNVGSGGIGYESPGAYPTQGHFADSNINRANTNRGRSARFNPGAGDPSFNPAGVRSSGFGRRR